jgi:hypothetical protein
MVLLQQRQHANSKNDQAAAEPKAQQQFDKEAIGQGK